jgi:glycosyltransferase involved in cell wall biosynthesis
MRVFRRFSTHMICISEAVRRSTAASGNRVTVLLDPAPDLIGCEPGNQAARLAARAGLGIPADTLVVGTIAKFVEEKGHQNLVELARRVRDQDSSDWVFVIVGTEVEGHEKYYANLRRQVLEQGLDQTMVFTGYQEDIPGMLEAMDVLAHLPDWEEPLGSVVMEAMAMEKPVVAFESGGIPELVTHGETGFLVPRGDLAAAEARIIELHNDPALRRRMGSRGRQLLLEEFSLEAYREKIMGLYDAILKPSRT